MKSQVCDYIIYWVERNLTTGYGIKLLEAETGYSEKTLTRWFFELYRITPGEYIYRRRMTRASVLLKMTALSVTEIACLLHYYSGQNFSRAFKKITGKSPKEYRKSDDWSCNKFQLPLFLNRDMFSAYQVVSIPNVYIKGTVLNGAGMILPSGADFRFDKFIRNTIDFYSESGRKDMHLAATTTLKNLAHGRRNEIGIQTYAGVRVDTEAESGACVDAGTYIRWSFSGGYNDYAMASKFSYLLIMLEAGLRKRTGYDYVHFHPCSEWQHNDKVICDMYIPVVVPGVITAASG